MKIVLVKLVSGEEVIGRLQSNDSNSLILEKARVLAVRPTPTGEMGIAMIPFLVGDPDGLSIIHTDKIMAEGNQELPKQLEDGYIQNTSDIQLAT